MHCVKVHDLGQQRNHGGSCATRRKIGKRVEFNAAVFAWPVLLQTSIQCTGGHHLGRGGMPLHDAVGINCKTGATPENQGADFKYMD